MYKNKSIITGLGIISAIGQGKEAFFSALLSGRSAFAVMHREGRQKDSAFLGAEIGSIHLPETISQSNLRQLSLTEKAALAALHEAWEEAELSQADPQRIGLVIGGTNLQQRELVLLHEKYAANPFFLRPNYGLSFLDTDVCGVCTEHFGIKGQSFTIGGASASGQLAVIQAANLVESGALDVCIAIGALMDLSHWECRAFRSMGAMGSDKFADQPQKACRPFDQNHDGFIYGESCGAVVVESMRSAEKRGCPPYGTIISTAMAMDAHRNPDPSPEGEIRVIQEALTKANLSPKEIDYINPHGTGSLIGDQIELESLQRCGLSEAYINATKSITGHGISSAGAVEIIASLLQMKHGQLHPTLNLDHPLLPFSHLGQESIKCDINKILCLSFGFGGINTALCLQK